ncbi:MAG: ribonuclease R, partial [Gemmatimonadota bacterium]
MASKNDIPEAGTILEQLKRSRRGPLKPKELADELNVPTRHYRHFKNVLNRMVDDGKLYRIKGNRYAVPEKINLVVGRLRLIRAGDGFVIPTDGKEDVFVPSSALESAMDGDHVVVRIERRPRGRQPVGQVIKVLERAHPTIVG